MSRYYSALILPKLILPTLLLLLIPVFAGQTARPADSGPGSGPDPAAEDMAVLPASADSDGSDGSNTGATLMVIGFDGESHYAGSVLLIRLDSRQSTLRTVRIAGNSYVRDSACPDGRLGSAFAKGYADARAAGSDEDGACRSGAGVLARLIEQTLGVRTDGRVSLSYADFAAIVDRAGGVDVELPEEMICSDGLRLPAGKNHMDGATAERFVRSDPPDGEIHPQRLFLTGLLRKVKHEFPFTKAVALACYAYGLSHSDLDIRQMLPLLCSVMSVNLSDARIAELSGAELTVNGRTCRILNRSWARDLVNGYLGAAQSDDTFDPGERLTDPSDPSIEEIYRSRAPGMEGIVEIP